MKTTSRISNRLPLLFLACRLFLVIALPLEGLRGYGDLVHFYRLAGMGWPFLDFWVEFPPLFPFLSTVLYRLAGGRQHVFDYLLVLAFSLFQALSLAVFLRIARRLHPEAESSRRSWAYFALTLGLAYGWWYFDPIAVFAMLLGVLWILEGKDGRAGIALAFGALAKLFPVLALVMAWRYRPARRALLATAICLGITALVYGVLAFKSPDLTLASLRSQGSKGSWESVWALLDGNLNTGNFGPLAERFDPSTAGVPRGNPPVIPPWIMLVLFAGAGAWLFWQSRNRDPRAQVALLGLTWSIFLLWSPGWSPQWVLYLLPLALLALPEKEGLLAAVILALLNLLEWPVLLSRGYTWGLWLTVPARTLVLVLLAIQFWQITRNPFEKTKPATGLDA